MTQYIPKSALMAEILKRREINKKNKLNLAAAFEDNYLLSLLNNLEVRDVDLEEAKKEELAQKYIDYTFKRHNIDPYSKEGQLIYYAYMHGMNQCLTQLRAQKGE